MRWKSSTAEPTLRKGELSIDSTVALLDRVESHWLASGFAGSNFAEDADEASVDFGGTVGYFWHGVVGGEFQANFSPEFELDAARSSLPFADEPWINSYMANAVGALPLGDNGRWRPYVSGGLGVLTLRSDTLGNGNDVEPDDSRFAGNIGGGLLGFVSNVGFRGDVRFFRGFTNDGNIDPVENQTEAIGNQILSGLQFWLGTAGIAFRW